MLRIKNITVEVESQPIVTGTTVDIKPGEIHAIMGPKHSGKSAFVHTITGHPDVRTTKGSIIWNKKKISEMAAHEIAQQKIFITFQNPPEFPDFESWELSQEFFGKSPNEISNLRLKYIAYCELLGLSQEHSRKRLIGGLMTISDAKRNELVHMLLFEPKLAILDEIDDGLNENEVEMVGSLIKDFLNDDPNRSCLLVTQNQKLLDILKPTHVHVIVSGKIKTFDDASIYKRIIADGYSNFS